MRSDAGRSAGFGIALGYEDLVDHDQLRHDPVLSAMVGKLVASRSSCAAMAGKSTLNRLELGRSEPTRYHRIGHDGAAIERLFVDLFLEAHRQRRRRSSSISMPPMTRCMANRRAGSSTATTAVTAICRCTCSAAAIFWWPSCGRPTSTPRPEPEEVERIVSQIRERWPRVRIVLRADFGFTRETLMAWCEAHDVDYLFGLARNPRLAEEIEDELAEASAESAATGCPARRFKDFQWTTLKSWSRRRRVVGKGEWTRGEANPRFVVTSLTTEDCDARSLYEDIYCARGEMENRIKEQQLDLFADRTSAATMRANQLRLWFASMAYVLIDALRRIGLAGGRFADATCGTIRLKLLKIGALVRLSVRRLKVAMASVFPYQEEYRRAYILLAAATR